MMRLAHAFKATGYRVTVVTARALPNGELSSAGIDCLVKEEARGPLRALLFRQFRMRRLVNETRADCLLGFNYYTPVPIPQGTYHINVIPFLDFPARQAAVGWARAVMQNRMSAAAIRRSTINLFESEHVRALAEGTTPCIRNPAVAYIGAEFDQSAPACPTDRVLGPFVTITSGARHKRNDLTVAFFRKLLGQDPDARLELVGDAEAIRAGLSPDDRRFLEACGAASFRGYIGRDELFALLARSRGLVTFSELESFFMVGIEAMAVGCPVIGADNSSIRESLGDAGLLVPSGDVDAAVREAQKLSVPETVERLQRRGQEWAGRFKAEQCASEFVRIFEHGIRDDAPRAQGQKENIE
jgi:glycosyltransferase involved in cell wall biosynthesis